MTFSNYSSLEQHLHNQFLGNSEISNFLYERINENERWDNIKNKYINKRRCKTNKVSDKQY